MRALILTVAMSASHPHPTDDDNPSHDHLALYCIIETNMNCFRFLSVPWARKVESIHQDKWIFGRVARLANSFLPVYLKNGAISKVPMDLRTQRESSAKECTLKSYQQVMTPNILWF